MTAAQTAPAEPNVHPTPKPPVTATIRDTGNGFSVSDNQGNHLNIVLQEADPDTAPGSAERILSLLDGKKSQLQCGGATPVVDPVRLALVMPRIQREFAEVAAPLVPLLGFIAQNNKAPAEASGEKKDPTKNVLQNILLGSMHGINSGSVTYQPGELSLPGRVCKAGKELRVLDF